MKNALLALALFAVVGTATANDGKPGKKDKALGSKAVCVKGDACCAKKSLKTATAKAQPIAPASAK